MEIFVQQDGVIYYENADGQGIVAYENLPLRTGEIPVATQKLQDKSDLNRLVKQVLGNQFEWEIDEFGKPWPSDRKGHISFSHSRSHVAFSFHPNTNQGIDVEEIRPQLHLVANRILHPNELEMLNHAENKQDLLQLFWGAKEAMYKAYGKRQLEFASQLITRTLPTRDSSLFTGQIILNDAVWNVTLRVIRPDQESYLVFVQDVTITSPM
jgi:phosphopantetheine--protein transferase-like protein